jgi:outer membrane receptor for ferrienterochelin and colicins
MAWAPAMDRARASLGADYELPTYRITVGGNFNYISALDRESSATVKQSQGARRQLDLYALYKLDRQVALRFSAQNVTRENRSNYLVETDAAGLLQRTETDFSPGLASYMLTLEAKW